MYILLGAAAEGAGGASEPHDTSKSRPSTEAEGSAWGYDPAPGEAGFGRELEWACCVRRGQLRNPAYSRGW